MPLKLIEIISEIDRPISLSEAKAHLRLDFSDEDDLVSIYLDAAIQAASDRLQRALMPARYLLALPAFKPSIDLHMPPVMSVDSVKYIDVDGVQQTLASTAYQVDTVTEPARLVPLPGQAWPSTQPAHIQAVGIQYTAGYDRGNIPLPIKQWILLALGDMYQNRGRSADRPVVPQGFADSLLDTYRVWSL